MKKWNLSCFTNIIKCKSGDILLHNSYMGAVARIPARLSKNITRFFQKGINSSDIDNRYLKELCEQGFFVDSDLDERRIVTEELDKERDSTRFNLIILPHENCNFRCVYCYEKFERGRMKEGIGNALKIFVNNNIKEYKGLTVGWFGGEPLLASDIIYELSDAFIKSCIKNNVTYTSGGMTTNGYLLTSNVVDELFKYRIKNFQVTLDGPASIHDRYRKLAGGGKTYEKILNNLIDMRNRNDEFRVRIRINFNENSLPLIEQWLDDEIAPLFANDSRFTLYFEPIGNWGGSNDAVVYACDSKVASPTKFIKKTQLLGFSDEAIKDFLRPHGQVCYAGRKSSIIVGSDGIVYKCTVAFDDPRNVVGHMARDGQLVLDKTLWDMWTGIDKKDTSWCNLCKFFPCCQGRKCPLSTINFNKPICPMTRKEYEALVKLLACGEPLRFDTPL